MASKAPAKRPDTEKTEKSKKRMLMQDRAGILFPVAKIKKYLSTNQIGARSTDEAAVYMCAVLQYMVSEIGDTISDPSSGVGQRKDGKPARLTATLIGRCIKGDVELLATFPNVTVKHSGVLPHIHPFLIPKRGRAPADPQAGGAPANPPAAIKRT